MKRALVMVVLIATAHFLAVRSVAFLAGIPVFANLYLGTFGSSSSWGSFFTLLWHPVFWGVATFHPQSLRDLTPVGGLLYLLSSSIFYGVFGMLARASLGLRR